MNKIWKFISSDIRSEILFYGDASAYIIQLLPLSEGDMTICSPETGNITCRG